MARIRSAQGTRPLAATAAGESGKRIIKPVRRVGWSERAHRQSSPAFLLFVSWVAATQTRANRPSCSWAERRALRSSIRTRVSRLIDKIPLMMNFIAFQMQTNATT